MSYLRSLVDAAWRLVTRGGGGSSDLRLLLSAGAGASLATFLFLEFYKILPGSYHIRLFTMFGVKLLFRPPLGSLDKVIISRSIVRLADLDWNGHVNNGVYALDADLQARYPFMCALMLNKGTPFRARGSIGTAVFFFLKEMRWRARYRIETRCVGVDEKWIYTESRWFLEGTAARARPAITAGGAGAGAMPQEEVHGAPPPASPEGDTLAAVKLTRFVFKEPSGPNRGKTVPPSVAFSELDLALPERLIREGERLGALFTAACNIGIRPNLKGGLPVPGCQ